jgi:hypothetical protein
MPHDSTLIIPTLPASGGNGNIPPSVAYLVMWELLVEPHAGIPVLWWNSTLAIVSRQEGIDGYSLTMFVNPVVTLLPQTRENDIY